MTFEFELKNMKKETFQINKQKCEEDKNDRITVFISNSNLLT